MIGIYKIKNIINNKIYVGQSQNIVNRFNSHKRKLNKNIHPNIILQQAWKKYKEDSFVFEIIEECSLEELNEKEEYYIQKHKSNQKSFGYNIRLQACDNRGLKWSDNQREKMNIIINNPNSWYKNHTILKSTLEKAWEANKNRVLTTEHKELISKNGIGKKKRNTDKMKIAQYGINNPMSKLTEIEVKEIKVLLTIGIYKNKDIAIAYNIKYSNITAIKKNRSWKNTNYKADEYDMLLKSAIFKMKGVI